VREHSFALGLSVHSDFVNTDLEVDTFTILRFKAPGKHAHCCPNFQPRGSPPAVSEEIGSGDGSATSMSLSEVVVVVSAVAAKERHHVLKSLRMYERVGGGRHETRRVGARNSCWRLRPRSGNSLQKDSISFLNGTCLLPCRTRPPKSMFRRSISCPLVNPHPGPPRAVSQR